MIRLALRAYMCKTRSDDYWVSDAIAEALTRTTRISIPWVWGSHQVQQRDTHRVGEAMVISRSLNVGMTFTKQVFLSPLQNCELVSQTHYVAGVRMCMCFGSLPLIRPSTDGQVRLGMLVLRSLDRLEAESNCAFLPNSIFTLQVCSPRTCTQKEHPRFCWLLFWILRPRVGHIHSDVAHDFFQLRAVVKRNLCLPALT